MGRLIFHVDVNSAFLSWEAAYRIHMYGAKLDLRTVPSAVGGDKEKRHGIILTKSIPAKKYGIQTGETVGDAKRKCPELILVPPNYDMYNRASKALIRLLREYTDRIEQYSIDEAFMDLTGSTTDPVTVANEIRERVKKEQGYTVNVGVSVNKLLAKMASDFRKPNLVHTLWPDEIPEKMWPLPVEDLFYVGRATKRKLSSYGIHTIGELANTEVRYLHSWMKSHGDLVWSYANGIDDNELVIDSPPNKGYGNTLTTYRDVSDPWLAKQYLLSLAEMVSSRICADKVKIRVIAVSICDYDMRWYGHQRKLYSPTDLTLEIYSEACSLFDEIWDRIPIRHLGIHTSEVVTGRERQLSLFETTDYEKQKKAEQAVDALRKKYGQDVVMRASFLHSPYTDGTMIDHMGGGISREKRTVDYSREIIL